MTEEKHLTEGVDPVEPPPEPGSKKVTSSVDAIPPPPEASSPNSDQTEASNLDE